MSIKPILFFLVLFGCIVYAYFYSETVSRWIPGSWIIRVAVLIVGLLGVFFPSVIQKWRDGDSLEELKEHMIEKYKKKE